MSRTSLRDRTQRWLGLRMHRRLLALGGNTGVVSFSFDDAPQSACQTGAAVLEKHSSLGTWYVAGGLTDQMDQGHMSHSVQDLQALHAKGHQVGCHTYSHVPCSRLRTDELHNEFQRNDDFLRDCGISQRPLHFSFPLGAYDLNSKAVAGKHFASCRITGGGVQLGFADLNALKSERLYTRDIQLDKLAQLVRRTAEHKGWLIFYSHDVAAEPSTWGCTPDLLDRAVQLALDAGCKVLPVDQAISHWQAA